MASSRLRVPVGLLPAPGKDDSFVLIFLLAVVSRQTRVPAGHRKRRAFVCYAFRPCTSAGGFEAAQWVREGYVWGGSNTLPSFYDKSIHAEKVVPGVHRAYKQQQSPASLKKTFTSISTSSRFA